MMRLYGDDVIPYCFAYYILSDRQVEKFSSRLPKWSTWHAIPNKTSPLPLPATSPPLLPSSSPSPEDLLQEFELQIMNQEPRHQDVVQI